MDARGKAFAISGQPHRPRVAFEQREIWTNRVSTARLNRWFEGAVTANPPPAPGGKRIKLRYITQARTRPPTFVVFGTRTDALPGSYERYLVNGMRKELGFQGVPVRLLAMTSILSPSCARRQTGCTWL